VPHKIANLKQVTHNFKNETDGVNEQSQATQVQLEQVASCRDCGALWLQGKAVGGLPCKTSPATLPGIRERCPVIEGLHDDHGHSLSAAHTVVKVWRVSLVKQCSQAAVTRPAMASLVQDAARYFSHRRNPTSRAPAKLAQDDAGGEPTAARAQCPGFRTSTPIHCSC
jgi:hypothetical protein